MPHLLLIALLLAALIAVGCAPSAGTVTIHKSGQDYQLLRDGEPYTILGVGGFEDLPRLKRYGANTVRTWDAEGMGPLLDRAHENGIAVVMGIWLEHQRHDFDYDAPGSREQQLERVERLVTEFRDHPALLAWGVGNEVELGGDFDVALRQIRDASQVVKRLDPNHPTMAVIAEIGNDKAIRIQNECPDIDMIGINSYGGMGSITQRLAKQGYTGPYAITEFGPVGFWETGRSPWGAPYEQTSSQKADFIRANYTKTVEPNLGKQCLGSFAFLWGHKQETTETWFGLLLPTGESTESVDVLSTFWTGSPPDNLAPRVVGLSIDAEPGALRPGQTILATVDTSDPDGDPLAIEWRLFPESTVKSEGGDREERIDPVDIGVAPVEPTGANITLPAEPGNYRLFVTVRDGHNHAGTANIPIHIVEP